MSYSIPTLLIRNLDEVFGENDPKRRRAAIEEIFTEDCMFYDPRGASTEAAPRSIAARARSGLLTLTFDISQLQNPRNWAMAGGSNGCRAALVRRQLTPGLISSLPRTAGLPPFISFSISYPELDSAVRRLCIGSAGGIFRSRTAPVQDARTSPTGHPRRFGVRERREQPASGKKSSPPSPPSEPGPTSDAPGGARWICHDRSTLECGLAISRLQDVSQPGPEVCFCIVR